MNINKKLRSALLAISLFAALGSNLFSGYEEEFADFMNVGKFFDNEASEPLGFVEELFLTNIDYDSQIKALGPLIETGRRHNRYTVTEVVVEAKREAAIKKLKNKLVRECGLFALREEELKVKINLLPAVEKLVIKLGGDMFNSSAEVQEICNSNLTLRDKFEMAEKHVRKTPEFREMREKMKREMDELPEVIRLREKFAADSSNK